MKTTSKNQNSANSNVEEILYFCPSCHNIRVKNGAYTNYTCNRCESYIIPVISKMDYNNRNEQQRKQIIKDFKSTYPEVATPTEILLKRLIVNTNYINNHLSSIRSMITFYFVLTIIGVILLLLSSMS